MERSAYRIVDANLNRGREAIRVVEEYCRFALNCESLWGQAKQLRHKLSKTAEKLDQNKLLASRDVSADVGAGRIVADQFERKTVEDTCKAACKRLTEALRALAEMAQLFDRQTANDFERLRFEAYDLEKRIATFAAPAERFKETSLYVVISSGLASEVINITQKCISGRADCIQLRPRGMSDDQLRAVAVEFVGLCREGGVLSIINDRADIAVVSGADGVHVGQNDLPVEQVRRLQLSPLIVGKSTHSFEQLERACANEITYAALGPVYATPTKPSAQPVGLEYVRQASNRLLKAGICGVAIGGINQDNVEDVLKAGARTIAVCSAITEAKEPADACRKLKDKIVAFNESHSIGNVE